MKYIFFGSPEFAAIILEKLISAGYIPEAVVCNSDKPVGRKKIITSPPAKQIILKMKAEIKNKIKILQPEKSILQNIYNCCDRDKCIYQNCDLFIVAAYAKIIPKEILKIPRLGTIGIHPSLLPRHRGSSPIQTAILKGDKETGTTLYLMDEKIDHGKIISNLKSQISKTDNYEILMRRLAELSADLLIELLRKYEKIRNYEKIIGVPQNESIATYTKKFKTEDAYIEPRDLEKAEKEGGEIAEKIERKIRALNPEPGVWTQSYENTKVLNKRVKLLEANLNSQGKLHLKKIQVDGKKPVEIGN